MKSEGISGSGTMQKIAERAGRAFGEVFNKEKPGPAHETETDAQATLSVPTGSISEPVSDHPEPPAADPDIPVIRSQPTTINSKDYETLKDEYKRFFFGGFIRDNRLAAVKRVAERMLDGKTRYKAVGDALGIPWWFIAAIHMMESGGNFHAHLHNGDPLNKRTVNWPPGRPQAAPANGSTYTWEESATDALKLKKLDREENWTLTRALYRWERYNGWGYRQFGVPTPYLWSFSSVYEKGKYIRDHVFDRNAKSKQVGAGVLLKFLYKSGDVTLYEDENEQVLDPDFEKEASETPTPPAPPVVSPLPPFDQFFKDHFPGQMNFSPSEFLVKGASHGAPSHRCHGLNTDPPEDVWDNVVDLVRVLQEFRTRIGAPVRLLSVYRSKPYNTCIGGASKSHHMAFRAADFVVLDNGTGPVDWARILNSMRGPENLFKGGLKAYRTFTHVDTRGHNANW